MTAGRQAGAAVVFWAVACWPLAVWYGRRLAVPDQAWLALAPLAAAGLAWRNRRSALPPQPFARWIPAILLLVLFAALDPVFPMTLRALPAVAALLFVPGPWRRSVWPDAPTAGLCVAGLPAFAMMQLFFGYPLQAAAAAMAVPVLRMAGLRAVRDGALLTLNGVAMGVDTACGGIRMGWAAIWLALVLAGLNGLRWRGTLLSVGAALALAVLLNAVRVAVLFLLAVAGLGGRPALHAGVGVVLFLGLATAIAAWSRWAERRSR